VQFCGSALRRHGYSCQSNPLLCCFLLPAGQLEQLLRLPWAGALALKRNSLEEPVPVVEVSFMAWAVFGRTAGHHQPRRSVPAYLAGSPDCGCAGAVKSVNRRYLLAGLCVWHQFGLACEQHYDTAPTASTPSSL
jgi:hypothetical protein